MWEQIVRDAASGAAVSVRKRDLKKRKQKKTKKTVQWKKADKTTFSVFETRLVERVDRQNNVAVTSLV